MRRWVSLVWVCLAGCSVFGAPGEPLSEAPCGAGCGDVGEDVAGGDGGGADAADAADEGGDVGVGEVCRTDDACDNGLRCDGVERCAPEAPAASPSGCVAGVLEGLDDGVACTVDVCDEQTGTITHQPSATCACEVDSDCLDATLGPCIEARCTVERRCEVEIRDGASCERSSACFVSGTCDASGYCLGAGDLCDDGNNCNGLEVCSPGVTGDADRCLPGEPVAVEPRGPCEAMVCESCAVGSRGCTDAGVRFRSRWAQEGESCGATSERCPGTTEAEPCRRLKCGDDNGDRWELEDDEGGEDTDLSCSGREVRGLIALYGFTEGSGDVVRNAVDAGTLELVRTGGGTGWLATRPGLWFSGVEGSGWVASQEQSLRLREAIQGSQQFTVELWARPDTLEQSGPARLLTYSSGTNYRNFTVGQSNGTLSFRLRWVNPDDGDQGRNGLPNLDFPQVLTTQAEQHYVITYRDRVVRLFVDGREVGTQSREADLAGWHTMHRLMLGNETSGDRAWRGEIYLVALYSVALTPEQASRHFAAGSRPGPLL